MVHGLAQVVEQTGALGDGDVLAELGGHEAGQLGDLDGVVVDVLAVAGAVLHAPDELDQLGMQAHDVGLQHGALALGLDGGVDLALGELDHLLDAGRVDPPIEDELLQGQPRDLAADGVEAGDGDRLRRVVDDEIDARERFNGADVAALAADDASLHLVIGQGNHADGDLGDVIGGAALDGGRHDLAGILVRFVLGAGLDLLDLEGSLVGDLGLDLLDQVFLGLVSRKAGDALEHLGLAALDDLDLFVLLIQSGVLLGKGFFLLFDRVGLAVDVFFLLL